MFFMDIEPMWAMAVVLDKFFLKSLIEPLDSLNHKYFLLYYKLKLYFKRTI